MWSLTIHRRPTIAIAPAVGAADGTGFVLEAEVVRVPDRANAGGKRCVAPHVGMYLVRSCMSSTQHLMQSTRVLPALHACQRYLRDACTVTG
jgi:hypothetical protein